VNLYKSSWQLYVEHSKSFQDDFEYYKNFVSKHSSLELFAGYGRITNYLVSQGADIETIELSEDFSKFINLPPARKHVGDVREVVLNRKFERIFAGYNSFCLLLEESDIRRMFQNVKAMLSENGQVSLSYYHPNYWHEAVPNDFVLDNQNVQYRPMFDLSSRKEKRAIWTDIYSFENEEVKHSYPVRIYESDGDLEFLLTGTGLKLSKKIMDYNLNNISEPGWVEYILEHS
jgi:hypothetical protein